jgi:ferrous iron transport protein A
MQLKELTVGKKSRIIKLLAKGIQRRRLLDLGIIPGTEVIVKRRSPSGDPTAYLIKGTIIALREEETSLIIVEEINARKKAS